MTPKTPFAAGKSGAIRSSRASAPTTVLVMSQDPLVREGWARTFEALGMRAMRCAGPENTSCALESSARCPLHDDADVAFYDQDSVTAALAVKLLTLPRTLPITLARDRMTPEGGHEPIPVQLLDPRGQEARARIR
jgi:hypothetical protein